MARGDLEINIKCTSVEAFVQLQTVGLKSFLANYETVTGVTQQIESQVREQIQLGDSRPISLPPTNQFALPPAPPANYQPQPLLPPPPTPTPPWYGDRPITVESVTAQTTPGELVAPQPKPQPATAMGRAVKATAEFLAVTAIAGLVAYGGIKWLWPQFQNLVARENSAETQTETPPAE